MDNSPFRKKLELVKKLRREDEECNRARRETKKGTEREGVKDVNKIQREDKESKEEKKETELANTSRVDEVEQKIETKGAEREIK